MITTKPNRSRIYYSCLEFTGGCDRTCGQFNGLIADKLYLIFIIRVIQVIVAFAGEQLAARVKILAAKS
jgi:hypothetical protein